MATLSTLDSLPLIAPTHYRCQSTTVVGVFIRVLLMEKSHPSVVQRLIIMIILATIIIEIVEEELYSLSWMGRRNAAALPCEKEARNPVPG